MSSVPAVIVRSRRSERAFASRYEDVDVGPHLLGRLEAGRAVDGGGGAGEGEAGRLAGAVARSVGELDLMAGEPAGECVAREDGFLDRGPGQPERRIPADMAPEGAERLALLTHDLGVDGLAAIDAIDRHFAAERLAAAKMKLGEELVAVI